MKEESLNTRGGEKKEEKQLNKRKTTNKTMKQWLLKSMTLPLLQQREIPTAHMPLHPNTHTLFVTLL